MSRFLLRRIGGALFVLLALSVVVYAAFYVAPGNVAQIACGPRCSPAQVAQVSDQLRLGDPLYLQYAHFLQGIFAGRDYSTGTGILHCQAPCLGRSYQNDEQVTQMILTKLPATASLAIGAFVLWIVLGVGTGLLSVWRRGRATERLLTGLTLAGMATPVFVIGLLLIIVFCSALQLLPFPDYVPLTENPEQWAWNLLLPWVSLALVSAAPYARMTRASMLETLAEDHVRTFRAYGVSERKLVGRHALRGALGPVIALGALDIGSMFGGAVLTESLFNIPGVGRELVDAVKNVDLPVVVGLVLVTGFFVVLANAVADILQAMADRRVVLA
ncbi:MULTISPECIES: ABC transporter permease [Streptomyces]|jgi:peptide/nickel transport system permease protein|uniref:ABC transporter permease n=1 Tax=Streptomyces sp. 900116325 TaxID=3154295 RepID=A0ABV2U1A2_9ACTN|nr:MULTISPECIES: ABC transporter permease [unclassified Streptomyces]MDX2732097.1 ABC transporter permease [Streptomyces sp. PA03-2a]MDX3764710.1 ABC transporter permease [Streptomyces sp. AK08-01B]MDX3814289.1 ABC transporter permease [Streptomyces sp. AK08-01A]WSQ27508.1 ABC transporter permease [Streptomyces sp. NBC_01230]SCY53628.1 peptide/nickel transport system permease protein [Streptomyces sp. 136MFCol5.1]